MALVDKGGAAGCGVSWRGAVGRGGEPSFPSAGQSKSAAARERLFLIMAVTALDLGLVLPCLRKAGPL